MGTALRAKLLWGLSMFLSLTVSGQTNAWINEIHYDNSGTDANETIEVVIENPGARSDYKIYLYRDSGTVYESVTLDDASIAEGVPVGDFSIYTWRPNSIQNGAADGIALVYHGTIIPNQFLSYEGTLMATEGPAKGLTSTDIVVLEGAETSATESLQLSGSGLLYSDFSWSETTVSTFGSVNMKQALIAAGNPAPSILNIVQNPTAENVTPNDAVSISVEITDANGIASASLIWGFTSGNLTNTIPMSLEGGNTYTTNAKIPVQPDGTSVYYEITATDKNTMPASTNSPEQFYISETSTSTIYTYDGTSWSPANPNDYATTSDNVVVQSGTAIFNENISINNITLEKDAVLKIEQVLELHGTIINDGSLVFVNDNARLGQLATVPITSSVSGSGTVTVQRYIPARNTFRLLSSPVTTTTSIHDNWQEGANASTDNPNMGYGTHITGTTVDQTNGFDGTITGASSMFTFDNNEQTWNKIANTSATPFTAGKAYRLVIRGDRSIDLTEKSFQPTNTILRASGRLIIGGYTHANLSKTAGGFNLIGNPYQAMVNMNKVLENSTNLNPHQYYVWDPNLNERGGYVTVSLPVGTNFLNSDANQFLQPGQAVFVRTLHAGVASILFEETDKAPFQNPTDVFRGDKKRNSKAYIKLQLYEAQAFLNDDPVADGLRVNFSADGSNTVLPNDAAKLGNIDENVALLNGTGDYLSLENRAMPVDGEVLHLFNNQYRHSDYTHKIKVSGFSEQMKVYLKDDYLQTSTELINNSVTVIDFSVKESLDGSMASNRFSLVFDLTKLSVKENALPEITIYPNPSKNGHFFITVPKMLHGKIRVSLYNILGQEVYQVVKKVGVNQKIELNIPGLNAGIYLVKISHGRKTFRGKVLIEK